MNFFACILLNFSISIEKLLLSYSSYIATYIGYTLADEISELDVQNNRLLAL